MKIKYIGAKIFDVFAIICNKDETFEGINISKRNFLKQKGKKYANVLAASAITFSRR